MVEDALNTRQSSNRLTIQGTLVSLVLLVGTASVFAVQHPVPLDPKADSSTCIQCHEDKTKGKSVHSAIAMGCNSCHEIRTNKDVTHVKLVTATPYRLCLTCHADKDASQMTGRVHPPAVRDCLTCHDPHTAEYKNQLRKPLSGDAKENLCLSCHQTGLNTPEKGSRHAALDLGCDTCHITHKVGRARQAGVRFPSHQSDPGALPRLPRRQRRQAGKAHQNQPFATANCVTCHDPHQSRSPKLMQAFLHDPFENKMCDTCHQPAKDGKVVLTRRMRNSCASPATTTKPS